MPSSIAHASVAFVFSPLLGARLVSRRLLGITAVAAALPDIDAIGRPFGHGDIAVFGGHRAVTHSVFFALAAAAAIARVGSRGNSDLNRWRIGAYVAAVVLSHGVLDAFTTYGEGVAFFAPLSLHRWKSPWQPFDDSLSEVVAIWLPGVLMYRFWLRARIGRSASARDAA
jgi:inner membrane protein